MFNVRLAGGHLYGKQLFTWVSLVVSLMASFVLSFFPLDVLEEICDLIESVSEGFLTSSFKPQAEKIIAEEQAGFRAGRSTLEQIFNLRILCEKYLQHQQNLYFVSIDFEKAFDRVWHAALWATMRKYNISANLVHTIDQLYDKATSRVQLNCSKGEGFRTTVGVRQGCLL